MKKYLLILVLFTSCATQKQAEKYYAKHPEQLAEVCIEKFPLDTISKTDTFYQKAENVDYTYLIDSIYRDFQQFGIRYSPNDAVKETDSLLIRKGDYFYTPQPELYKQVKKLKETYKPCKPDTITLTNTITVEDKRKLFIVQNDLAKEKKAHDKTSTWKGIFMWWAIATVLLAFLILINYFKIKI